MITLHRMSYTRIRFVILVYNYGKNQVSGKRLVQNDFDYDTPCMDLMLWGYLIEI